MRHRSEVVLFLAVTAFVLTGVAAVTFDREPDSRGATVEPGVQVSDARPVGASEWFASFRMYCNHVDIDSRLRWQPAPGGVEGDMYEAACYALAGRTEQARAVIEGVPQDRRYEAAGVVFEAGHSAADAGDETAAGPLMELVVEFWPNHYMALYHAGAAAYGRAAYAAAGTYLERFLQEYPSEDGWRENAVEMLDAMGRLEG